MEIKRAGHSLRQKDHLTGSLVRYAIDPLFQPPGTRRVAETGRSLGRMIPLPARRRSA